MRTSLAIPAYNEEEGLPLAAREYLDVVDEVIMVDDGSSDGTFQAAQALAGGKVKLLRHEVNQGKGAALRTRVFQDSGDAIIFTDLDKTYSARYVLSLLQEID